MKLEEFIEIANLLDIYSELLSEKQKKYLVEHFENDFSLSEIAESNGVSRQAIHDNIKRGINLLYEYEAKLNFYKKKRKILDDLKDLKKDLKEDFNIEKLDKIIEYLI